MTPLEAVLLPWALATTAGMLAWWWRARRAYRALAEWRRRWQAGERLCGARGCLQPPGDICHVDENYKDLGGWDFHAFVPARLVAEPVPPAREAMGGWRR